MPIRSMIGAFNNPDFVISKTYFKIPFPIYEKQMSQAYDVCEIAFSWVQPFPLGL